MAAFSVTSCTASRVVMTPEDTIDITMTVSNTFGSSLNTFGLCLCFTGEDRGAGGLWLPTVQAESAISWANGASKTFSWSIVPDAIMSQPQYASIYASLRSRLSAVRTLPFRLQLVGTSANGSYASMTYTLSGVQYIDKYYNPQITMDIWRYPDDESTSLAATKKVALAEGNNASGFTATMHYAQGAKATAASPVLSMNVDRDVLFGVGYSANTGILSGTFANGTVYSFLLVVTDGIETASAVCIVDRAFANMHLSGKTTGGVAFGKFSAATLNNPLFECEYPAQFAGGIHGITNYESGEVLTGGHWIDGKPIYRKILEVSAPVANTHYFSSGDSIIYNLDAVVKIDFVQTLTNGLISIPFYVYTSSNLTRVWLEARDGGHVLYVYTAFPGVMRAIVEYTKTTD
ncbi:MAG: hypothetical protein IJI59_01745 [Clostridia bacterium]|nr:hypothetical protein [Clostridia bacterium]